MSQPRSIAINAKAGNHQRSVSGSCAYNLHISDLLSAAPKDHSSSRSRMIVERGPTVWLLACGLACAVAAQPAAGQAVDPKTNFVQALARFSLYLDGVFGDEGQAIRSNLDAMSRGLVVWDATLRQSESDMATGLTRADPGLAAAMHVAMGGAYLDRGRVDDALKEFAEASRLNPTRADLFGFQGVAYSQAIHEPAKALESFRKALALEPHNPVRAYVLMRELSATGRTDEAEEAIGRFLDTWKEHATDPQQSPLDSPFIRLGIVPEREGVEPFFPLVTYAEGFRLLHLGEFEKAVAALREAAAQDPVVGQPVNRLEAMGLAAAALREGSVGAAREHLKVAVELEPNRAEAHRVLGRVYLVDQQDDEAIRELHRAVELAPNDERTHLSLDEALVGTGRWAEAEQALRETKTRFPSSGRARYSLARLYQRQGRNPEAFREFEDATGFNPFLGLNSIYKAMGELSDDGQNPKAEVDAYSRRVDVNPNDPGAHQTLGDAYLRLGQHERALAEFAIVLLLEPDRADACTGVSQAYLQSGRNAEAEAWARRAIARSPTLTQPRYVLATALMRTGQTAAAQQEFDAFQHLEDSEVVVKARRNQLTVLRRDASISLTKGDYASAIAGLRLALELSPDEVASHMELGLALLRAGQAAEAVDHFKAAQLLNAPADVHRQLAAAYTALGRTEDSQRELAIYEELRKHNLRGEER
jgi:tetratricopeptide (TPR) repeat protein